MGLLDTLKLPPLPDAGAVPPDAAAPPAAAPLPPAEPEPGVPGRDAAAFESAKKLVGRLKSELDRRWGEAVAIGRDLDPVLKVVLAGWLKQVDADRRKASSLSGDPPGQVVFTAKALIGLRGARKAVGQPMPGADDVAFDDGSSKVTVEGKLFAVAPEAAAAGGEEDASRLSGAHWVSSFPTSRSTGDLISPFGSDCDAFIAAIEAAGGSVAIAATLRPKQRAYLMHWAWMIGKGGEDPASVPAEAGVDIEWDHGDRVKSLNGAQAMISGYGLAYQPSLTSRHIEGRAIDMSVTGIIGKTMKDKDSNDVVIKAAKNLHAVGATYGVVKLLSDPPHWSDDGH